MNISVVISTMGRRSSVLRLIRNLHSQECLPQEIIIIEAGNTAWDNLLVSEFQKINFVLIHAEKTSLAEARDIGRKRSSGDIITFLDDDIIMPYSYIADTKRILTQDDSLIAIGGAYIDKGIVSKKSWKTLVGRILGIYSNGKRNRILSSGWADYVRNENLQTPSSADWLFGCNWSIKAKAFENKNIKIETTLARWSFLEDVILGHRLITQYGNCLKIIPSLEVIHDPIETSGTITKETIRMRILYRYVFWRYELFKDSRPPRIKFFLGMLANTLLMLGQKPSISTMQNCLISYGFIFFNSPTSYADCNKFIFSK